MAVRIDVETIRTDLERGLAQAGPLFGAALTLYSVKQQPPGEDRTFITYAARIGYALADESRLLMRMANGQSSPHVVPIEISVNEPICDAIEFTLAERFPPIRVSTIEDIVAEKLRALLQQTIRNRTRPQDLLDIALIVRARPTLDRDRIARYLRIKADARNVPVSRAAFRHPEVAQRAATGYAGLRQTTRTIFIPFDEALAVLLDFVDELAIPEK